MGLRQKKVVTGLVCTLLLLAIAEVISRQLVSENSLYLAHARTVPTPEVRSGWTPGWHGMINIDGVGGQKGAYKLQINSFGFRGQSMRSEGKAKNTVRIFFMGGSFVEEMALPEEKTFPALIERKFSGEFPNQRFECINAGISGFMSPDLSAQLQHQILSLSPDFIILVVPAINDIRYGTLPEYDPGNPLPSAAQTSGPSWFRHSRLLHILYRFTGRLVQARTPYSLSLKKFQRQAAQTPYSAIESTQSLGTFARQIRSIIETAQAHHVGIILTAEPSLYQTPLPDDIKDMLWMGFMRKDLHLSPEFLEKQMRLFNQTAHQLADKFNVSYIPLDEQVLKNETYFYDDIHLTPAGSYSASEAIYPVIKQAIAAKINHSLSLDEQGRP